MKQADDRQIRFLRMAAPVLREKLRLRETGTVRIWVDSVTGDMEFRHSNQELINRAEELIESMRHLVYKHEGE